MTCKPLDNGETFTDDLLIRLQEEIDNTLPEQRQAIFERIDIEKEVEKLWTK